MNSKQRKTDQFAWIKQIWVVIVSGLLLGVGGLLWSFPDVYAKKEDVEKIEKEFKATITKVDAKLDKILTGVNANNTEQKLQAKDIEYIKKSLIAEIERSKKADAEQAKKIEKLRNGRKN